MDIDWPHDFRAYNNFFLNLQPSSISFKKGAEASAMAIGSARCSTTGANIID
ncbi:MAG: hypothetical protein R2861_17275 [Desulfobacterales bacterium]